MINCAQRLSGHVAETNINEHFTGGCCEIHKVSVSDLECGWREEECMLWYMWCSGE